MQKENLIGSWKLISYKIIWPAGNEETYPYGPDAKGYLIYTPNHVSVHIMHPDRRQCTTQDFRGAAMDEKIEMADNYGGYVGTYEIYQNTVIHYPEISMYHNFTLTPQVRHFQFNEDQLILGCPYGKGGHSQLIWQRIDEQI